MQKIYFLIIFFLIPFLSKAQGKRLSVNTEYQIPGGELSWTYAKAPGIQLNFAWTKKKREGRSKNMLGASLGYTRFTPLEDTLYYLVELEFDNIGYGTAVYQDYYIAQLMATSHWENQLFSRFFIKYGIEMGFYYVVYSYDAWDETRSGGESVIEGKLAMVPVLGFVYNVSDTFGFGPYFKYNFYISIGESDPNSISHNPDVGKYDYFYSAGLGLYFNF